MTYHGKTFVPALDEARLNEQTVRVYRVMLDEQWRTLQEIAAVTHDPLPSISARLRDLRKSAFGGFDIQRRRRGLATSGLWEYRMQPPASAAASAAKARRTGFLAGLMYAAKIVAKGSDLACVKREIKAELIKAAKR
jgi:hypothetical protein